MDRRIFLKSLAGLTAAFSLPFEQITGGVQSDRFGKLLPLRAMGNTGKSVTMLGVGGWHIGRMSEQEAQKTIEVAIDGGIRFFDSAESYQRGGSETRLGKLLTPKYREEIFLMTKTGARDAETAKKHLEDSLHRLKTDYLDLWQMHGVGSPDDVDGRIDNGVLEVMREAKESGKVRHLGFTGHRRPSAHLRVLERTDIFETCQMPINVADPSNASFIENVLPKLLERKIAPLAMKTLANGGFFGGGSHGQHGDGPRVVPDKINIRDALYFAWSFPITVLITGPDNAKQLQQKIDFALNFQEYDEGKRKALIDQVSDIASEIEFYKA